MGPGTRLPAVAGHFYPKDPAEVSRQVTALSADGAPEQRAMAIVCPHAGWVYSGRLAGKLIAGTTVPERVIVLAPNHTGRGARGAVWPAGTWRLPGTELEVDEALCRTLVEESPLLQADRAAHQAEHSIEVLLPLLAARQPKLRISPVVLGHLDFTECESLGHTLARLIKAEGDGILLVASSDMNHFATDAQTRQIDRKALDPMLKLDARGLHEAVERHGISMCGYVPATVAVVAARELGAREAELVAYGTSADVSGDTNRVVGYAAVAFR